MREIEIKARVGDKANLLEKLAAQGVQLSAPKKQHDVVFCKPGQKDYDPGSIWLRIRTEDDKKVIFTLKKDTGQKLDSIEHEVVVDDAKELENILRVLGNEVYSDLTKIRQKGKWGEVEICVDEVENLGTYIEAEKLVADHNVDYDEVAAELWALLGKLGITKQDHEPNGYDVLLNHKQ